MASLKWSRYNTWTRAGGEHWVYNAVTGAFVSVPADTIAALNPSDDEAAVSCELSAAEVDRLRKHGVLVGQELDELSALEARHDLSREGGSAMSLTIVASLGCNFDCPYCFEDKKPSKLKPEVIDAIVGVVRSARPPKLSVTWFGGEPLMAYDEILSLSDRLIELCDGIDADYSARIVTNGWFLTAEVAEQLAARRVETAQVTLDGPDHVHDQSRPHVSGQGTFARIIKNIEESADKLPINIRVQVTPQNVQYVRDLFQELEDRGLKNRVSLGVAPLIDAPAPNAPIATYEHAVFTKSEYAAIELELMDLAATFGFPSPALPQPRSLSCAVITPTSAVVGPDGELWKCWDEVGDAAAVIGSIFEPNGSSPNLAKWHGYSPFNDETCRSCSALPVCMGGCPHLSFEHPLREAQCGAFRFNQQARVDRAGRLAVGLIDPLTTPNLDSINPAQQHVGVPVSLTSRPKSGADLKEITS